MNQTNQIPPASPTGGPAPTPTKPTVGSVAKLYVERAREFVVLAKSRLNADPKMKRLLMLAGGAFGVIFLLFVVAAIAQSVIRRGVISPTPTPTPEVTLSPEPTVLNPSRYATDSAILSLEESVKGINRDADSLDIREYNLRPPDLDFDINFLPSQ